MNPENNNGIKDRLNLEQRITRLETVVKEIAENHLVHIETKMDRIQWLLVITLVAIVMNLLSKYV